MFKCLDFWEWTAGKAAMGLRASRTWPYFPLNIHVGKTCILSLWYLTVFFHPVCVGLKLSVLCSPPFDFSPVTPASSVEWHRFGLISELKLFFTSRCTRFNLSGPAWFSPYWDKNWKRLFPLYFLLPTFQGNIIVQVTLLPGCVSPLLWAHQAHGQDFYQRLLYPILRKTLIKENQWKWCKSSFNWDFYKQSSMT